jgi:putative ABC transport system permease protein
VGWFTLIFAGLFTLAIAVITISFQAIKAALSNPIHSLRYE